MSPATPGAQRGARVSALWTPLGPGPGFGLALGVARGEPGGAREERSRGKALGERLQIILVTGENREKGLPQMFYEVLRGQQAFGGLFLGRGTCW